jgi:hypothetical protein
MIDSPLVINGVPIALDRYWDSTDTGFVAKDINKALNATIEGNIIEMKGFGSKYVHCTITNTGLGGAGTASLIALYWNEQGVAIPSITLATAINLKATDSIYVYCPLNATAVCSGATIGGSAAMFGHWSGRVQFQIKVTEALTAPGTAVVATITCRALSR